MEDDCSQGGVPVRVYVDPSCPFAWITTRWLVEVERQRPLDLEFHLVSLSVINERRQLDDWYRAFNDQAWGPSRVFAAVHAQHGGPAARQFYEAFGRRFHVAGDEDPATVVPMALAEAALPATLSSTADEQSWDVDLRASTQAAVGPVGLDVGTPILQLDDTAVFGPILTSCPRGDDAVRLFDAVRTMLATPGFSELQRRRPEVLDRSDPAHDRPSTDQELTDA
ncbi:MAG: disulfide bond formation protein DsbA [Actinomycetota bacterium]|nr:disulfide bond formation protein DsbA [Actinomycetota bacterium]